MAPSQDDRKPLRSGTHLKWASVLFSIMSPRMTFVTDDIKKIKRRQSFLQIAGILLLVAFVITLAMDKRLAHFPDLTDGEGSPTTGTVDAVGEGSIDGGERGGGRTRLMLVTGTDGRACSTTRGAEVLTRSLKNKVDYARLHGIPLYYAMEAFDDAFDIYWVKLPLLKKLMQTHPTIEWFMWVDCDAIFTDMARVVPLDEYGDYNLVLSGNATAVFEEPDWLGLNTGGFLLRNCAWSVDLLDATMALGNRYTTRRDTGLLLNRVLRGRAEASGDHEWPADDQTTLIYLLATQPHLWKEKTYLDTTKMYHNWWVEVAQRLPQILPGEDGAPGPSKWRPFISHFTGCKFCNMQDADAHEGQVENCLTTFDRLYRFADDQVLENFELRHKSVDNEAIEAIEPRA
ncbi:xylosyltransferase [Klebsormidium nitens]|uniref:Xylosyltransferase n=1 Tax=Klebsormidium nitens TaxID=105231 RepID=A0A1Y1HVE2_KLENI|nr:xylosyltransferase [Klebsormidium nitens]|eukprot:GAQ82133.1 xylosyltransferase [Klebsormidium nitens]